MNQLSYDPEITALLVIDPYNDLESRFTWAGRRWPRKQTMAEKAQEIER